MFQRTGAGALDYFPCRYGASKLLLRGPKRRPAKQYCAVIGGTETYGKFVEIPYPKRLEERIAQQVINLGCPGAGIDAFLHDPTLLDLCQKAEVVIVQTMGAQNMSNRFYSVHPRRNDRFIRASATMKAVFHDVDFTEFSFTRHMLSRLRVLAPDRYQLVEDELKTAWVARMKLLANQLPEHSILLHLRSGMDAAGLGQEPLFISAEMIEQVAGSFGNVVTVEPSEAALQVGTRGMIFDPMEAPAASGLPGVAVHDEVADALMPLVSLRWAA